MSMTEGGQLGKYKIVEELGSGGFATVFRAVDTTLDREVALKILHPPLLADRRFVQNFRHEAKTLAALRHPQIITIYEVGEVDGRIFIAMDLARGISLAKAIASRMRIPWIETLTLLKPVCDALDYAHEQGVVHRDLKPANVLIDRQRGALLTDFGFAKLLAENPASMTMSGGIVGTPGYIAPEVWEDNAADPPVDIYALGCIVYEMLTGDVLFKGATPIQAMRAHDRGPLFPEQWPDDVPDKINEVLAKALARDPAERYASASALWQALGDLKHQAQAGQTASVEPKYGDHAEPQAVDPMHAATLRSNATRHTVAEQSVAQGSEQVNRGTNMQARPTALQGALSSDFSTTALLLLPIAIAIDIGGGELVKLLQLPLWLDTIGTILIGALCGPWIGAIAGLLGHVIWWLLDLNQYAVWFAPSVGIAGLLAGFAGRLGLFQYTPPRWLSTLMGGALFFGLVLSAFMFTNSERNIGGWPSLPVAGEQVAQNELVFWAALALGLATGYFVLRGVGYAGFVGLITGVATAIVGAPIGAWLFLGEASSILGASIFGQNTVSDPLDKMLSFLVVYLIIQLLPRRVLQRFPNTRAGGGR